MRYSVCLLLFILFVLPIGGHAQQLDAEAQEKLQAVVQKHSKNFKYKNKKQCNRSCIAFQTDLMSINKDKVISQVRKAINENKEFRKYKSQARNDAVMEREWKNYLNSQQEKIAANCQYMCEYQESQRKNKSGRRR